MGERTEDVVAGILREMREYADSVMACGTPSASVSFKLRDFHRRLVEAVEADRELAGKRLSDAIEIADNMKKTLQKALNALCYSAAMASH